MLLQTEYDGHATKYPLTEADPNVPAGWNAVRWGLFFTGSLSTRQYAVSHSRSFTGSIYNDQMALSGTTMNR